MSEILDIEYYDRDLVDEAARKLKLPVSVVDREEESARKLPYNPFTRMKYPLGKGTSETQDAIFEAQENIIRFPGGKGDLHHRGTLLRFYSGGDEKFHAYLHLRAL